MNTENQDATFRYEGTAPNMGESYLIICPACKTITRFCTKSDHLGRCKCGLYWKVSAVTVDKDEKQIGWTTIQEFLGDAEDYEGRQ